MWIMGAQTQRSGNLRKAVPVVITAVQDRTTEEPVGSVSSESTCITGGGSYCPPFFHHVLKLQGASGLGRRVGQLQESHARAPFSGYFQKHLGRSFHSQSVHLAGKVPCTRPTAGGGECGGRTQSLPITREPNWEGEELTQDTVVAAPSERCQGPTGGQEVWKSLEEPPRASDPSGSS